ncbi:MAG: hypothetical protein HQK93_10370 [Nitrospirae bacterium]|nr:hypothetical protein [Nitrospirota bacterium]
MNIENIFKRSEIGSKFERSKLSTKIFASIAFILILFALVMLVYQVNTIMVVKEFRNIIYYYIEIEKLALKTENNMLQCRRDEKDFLLRLDKKYAAKLDGNISALQIEIDKIIKIANDEGDKNLVQRADSIKTFAQAYHSKFKKLVEAWEKKGFDENSGQQGDFRKVVHSLEDLFNKNSELSGFEVTLLQIRRSEKDYLLRKDKKYADKVHTNLDKLTNAVSNTKSAQKEDILKGITGYMTSFDTLVALDAEINVDAEEMRAEVHKIEPLIDEIVKTSAAGAAANIIKTTSHSIIASVLASICGLIALLIGVFSGKILIRSIVNPINDVIQVLTANSKEIAGASNQVSSSSQNVAAGAGSQASSLEQTMAAIEELEAMVTQNTENSKQAKTMSEDAVNAALKGVTAMSKMSEAIELIKTSSDKTAKIVKTINEIAFQTNLLALNAAVEAAHAGAAGMGFAVVAEEVRTLAQRSAQAAKTTSELIEVSVHNTDNGVSVANQVSGILNEIVEQIKKVGHLINEVTAATVEQESGLKQINIAGSSMNVITQKKCLKF